MARPANFGPGAAHAAELDRRRGRSVTSWTPARQLALLIAVGIGLHNFAEGLAIGQSAAAGQIALATLLVIGFALHNATEGFGITAPLAGDTYLTAGAGRGPPPQLLRDPGQPRGAEPLPGMAYCPPTVKT